MDGYVLFVTLLRRDQHGIGLLAMCRPMIKKIRNVSYVSMMQSRWTKVPRRNTNSVVPTK